MESLEVELICYCRGRTPLACESKDSHSAGFNHPRALSTMGVPNPAKNNSELLYEPVLAYSFLIKKIQINGFLKFKLRNS